MSKLRDRCSETAAVSFTANIGETIALDGAVIDPAASRTFATAYATVAGDSVDGIPIGISQGTSWQTGYATFNHDANSLTIDSISASSSGGAGVLFLAAAVVSVETLSDDPVGRRESKFYSAAGQTYVVMLVPRGAQVVTISISNLNLNTQGVYMKLTLADQQINHSTGYTSNLLATAGAGSVTSIYPNGCLISTSSFHFSASVYEGVITLRRVSSETDIWVVESNLIGYPDVHRYTSMTRKQLGSDLSQIWMSISTAVPFFTGHIGMVVET